MLISSRRETLQCRAMLQPAVARKCIRAIGQISNCIDLLILQNSGLGKSCFFCSDVFSIQIFEIPSVPHNKNYPITGNKKGLFFFPQCSYFYPTSKKYISSVKSESLSVIVHYWIIVADVAGGRGALCHSLIQNCLVKCLEYD